MEDFDLTADGPGTARRFQWVGGSYFTAMEIQIIAGRALSWADVHARAPVVVVSESLASEYWDWPGNAIGRRLSAGGEAGEGGWREIVGVVADVRDRGVEQLPPTIVYWPMITPSLWPATDPAPFYSSRLMFFAIRSARAGTAQLTEEARAAIASVSPNLALGGIQTMDQVVAGSMARTSFTLVMLAIAASVALLLGAIGVYGVVSYVVSQWTREMGIRVAIGAHPRAVQRMILGQGLRLAGIGVVVGLTIAFGTTRLMATFLFGVSASDPLTYALVSTAMIAISLLASYFPARRASLVDPVEALRSE